MRWGVNCGENDAFNAVTGSNQPYVIGGVTVGRNGDASFDLPEFIPIQEGFFFGVI